MLGTYYVNDFNKYDRIFKVQMQAESRFRNKATDLSGIYVKNNNGVMVPILSIVKLNKQWEQHQYQGIISINPFKFKGSKLRGKVPEMQ